MRNNKKIRLIGVAAALVTGTGAVFLFLKQRAKKRHFTAFMIAAVLLFGVMGASMTAYAYTDEDAEREVDLGEILTPVVPPAPTPEPTPTPTPEPQPLTPDGNLTLVDDISGEQANDKQFITVVTKSGNYFYLIIDRAGDKENVYFLNLVDEADLLALIEGKTPATATPAPVEPAPEVTPTPEPTPQPQKNNTTGLLIMLVIIGVVGGGAFYYFRVLKPKQGGTKKAATTELDEFEFDPDEDDLFNDDDNGQNSAEYDGDTDEDIPDFTVADDTEPDSYESEGG